MLWQVLLLLAKTVQLGISIKNVPVRPQKSNYDVVIPSTVGLLLVKWLQFAKAWLILLFIVTVP
jgi:hypothetical protein